MPYAPLKTEFKCRLKQGLSNNSVAQSFKIRKLTFNPSF